MSTKATSIVLAVLGVLLIALGGVVLISRQSTTAALSNDSQQIAQQAKQIARQAKEIASLRTQVTAAQQLAKTATQTSKGANSVHLGICVAASESNTDSYGDTYTALQSYDITAPQMSAGVASCPTGSFVSAVPGKP